MMAAGLIGSCVNVMAVLLGLGGLLEPALAGCWDGQRVVSRGAKAWASSELPGSKSCEGTCSAPRCCDGKYGNEHRWLADPEKDAAPWLVVDLGREYGICQVSMAVGYDGQTEIGKDRIADHTISV